MSGPVPIPADWEPYPVGLYCKARVKSFFKWNMIDTRKRADGTIEWRRKQ